MLRGSPPSWEKARQGSSSLQSVGLCLQKYYDRDRFTERLCAGIVHSPGKEGTARTDTAPDPPCRAHTAQPAKKVQERGESSHCSSYLAWKRKGMGGLEQLHPLLPAPCKRPQLGLGGTKGRRNPAGGRDGFSLLLSGKTPRDGDKEREKGGREREREQAPVLGVGGAPHDSHLSNLWHSPPSPPLGPLPPAAGGPWGSGRGRAGEGAYRAMQQHVAGLRPAAAEGSSHPPLLCGARWVTTVGEAICFVQEVTMTIPCAPTAASQPPPLAPGGCRGRGQAEEMPSRLASWQRKGDANSSYPPPPLGSLGGDLLQQLLGGENPPSSHHLSFRPFSCSFKKRKESQSPPKPPPPPASLQP